MRKGQPVFSCTALFCALFFFTITGAVSAENAISVSGKSVRIHEMRQGGTDSGTIIVQNNSDAPQTIRIYKTGFLYSADGPALFEEADSAPRSNMPWIRLDHEQVDLPPKEKATVTYTVKIPDSPELKGSYWSMVMIEPISPEDLTPRESAEKTLSMSIKTVTRQATQIVTEISGEGTAAMRFGQMNLTEQKDGLKLYLEVIGEGEKILIPDLWIEVYDNSRGLVGKFASDSFGLHPGCSSVEQIHIPLLPEGKYQALLVADCGGDNVFGIQTELVIQ